MTLGSAPLHSTCPSLAVLSGPQDSGGSRWPRVDEVDAHLSPPPLSLQPRGMGPGCGPLQSGSSPSIFLEGAEELVAMETEKRQEGMQGNTEVGLRSTP